MLTDEQIAKLDGLSQEFLLEFRQTMLNVGHEEKITPTLEVVIPAKYPEVGDIIAISDQDEMTVYIGDYFHCHFSAFLQDGYPSDEANRKAAEYAVGFISDFLADKIILRLNIKNGTLSSSQTYYRDMEEKPPTPEDREYVWSGRL